MEAFEPVQKKPRLDTVTEYDGLCMISNLSISGITNQYSVKAQLCDHWFYITDVDAYERGRKKQLDIDQDSAMGLSLSPGPNGKSAEASLFSTHL